MRILPDFPPIETARLHLRPLILSDAEAFQVLTDDPAITEGVDFLASPFDVEHARRLIVGDGKRRDCFWGAWQRTNDTLIGTVGTHLRGSEIEIGYWFATAAKGRGLASEAVGGVVGVLVAACPGCRLIAECRPENRASWRLLDRAGFRATGEEGRRSGRRKLALG